MQLLKQSKSWTCLPTAAAMVLGRTEEEIVALIGHDGSELTKIGNRIEFHIEEIQVAILKIGHAMCPYLPGFEFNDRNYNLQTSLTEAMQVMDGIIVGNYIGQSHGHAVAWSSVDRKIYDPAGRVCALDLFHIDCFHGILRIEY